MPVTIKMTASKIITPSIIPEIFTQRGMPGYGAGSTIYVHIALRHLANVDIMSDNGDDVQSCQRPNRRIGPLLDELLDLPGNSDGNSQPYN